MKNYAEQFNAKAREVQQLHPDSYPDIFRDVAVAVMKPHLHLIQDELLKDIFTTIEKTGKTTQQLYKQANTRVLELYYNSIGHKCGFVIPYDVVRMRGNCRRVADTALEWTALMEICDKLTFNYNPEIIITEEVFNLLENCTNGHTRFI